jgi:universal stress protein family protein
VPAKDAASSSSTAVLDNKRTKILVPHDGSAASDKALDTAIQFFARGLKRRSHIIFLNVVDDMFVPPSYTLSLIGNGDITKEGNVKAFGKLKGNHNRSVCNREAGMLIGFSQKMGHT